MVSQVHAGHLAVLEFGPSTQLVHDDTHLKWKESRERRKQCLLHYTVRTMNTQHNQSSMNSSYLLPEDPLHRKLSVVAFQHAERAFPLAKWRFAPGAEQIIPEGVSPGRCVLHSPKDIHSLGSGVQMLFVAVCHAQRVSDSSTRR